jgi:hypothetical protein
MTDIIFGTLFIIIGAAMVAYGAYKLVEYYKTR